MSEERPPSRPLPTPTATTRPYWEAAKAHRLSFQRCRGDGTVVFYPRVVCPSCGRNDFEWIDASGRGSIYSFTIVHRAPNEAFKGKTPYAVAIVQTDEGVRMLTNLRADRLEDIAIGRRVRVVFADVDDNVTLPEFELEV